MPPDGRGLSPRVEPASRSPVAPHVAIPPEGTEVPWSAALRADIPEYVAEQLREAAHQERCTLVAVLLRLMADHRDGDDERVFCIRPQDLVADRRKVRK